jgi:hypothetical protein
MSLPQDLTPLVRDWLHEPDGLPPPRLAEMAPLVHQTAQERGRLPRLDRGRFLMFSATKFVAASVILALVGGFLLIGSPTSRPAPDRVGPPATTSAPEVSTAEPSQTEVAPDEASVTVAADQSASMIPDVLPEGATSGMVDTPYGPARWVSVIGDASLFPRNVEQLLPGPTGYLALRGWTCAADSPPSCLGLWAADGLFGPWEEVPLPDVARASLLLDDQGTYWLLAGDPDGLYRSDDARDWHEVDQSAIEEESSPGLDRFTWHSSLHPVPVTLGDMTIAPVAHDVTNTLSVLGIPKAFRQAHQVVATDRPAFLEVRDAWHTPIGQVQVKETARGLQITNRSDGKVLATIDGLDHEDLDRLLAGGPMGTQVAIIVDDRVAEVIDVPWSGEAWGRTSIVDTDDAFRAYVPNKTGTFDVWRSTDGRTWSMETVVDPNPRASGQREPCNLAFFNPRWLRRNGWDYTAYTAVLLCDGYEYENHSADGLEWQQPPKTTGQATDARRLDSGWLTTDAKLERWWFRVGDSWQEAPEVGQALALPQRCEREEPRAWSWEFGDTFVELRSVDDKLPCPRVIRILEIDATEPSGQG